MTEETTPIWRYENGEWDRVPPPYDWDATSDYTAALAAAGFHKATSIGWPGMEEIEMWEHRGGEYLVDWCPAGSTVHPIYVPRIPDLIELMAKLAPFATAAMLSGALEQLSAVIDNAEEDGKRERDRRHPEVGRQRRAEREARIAAAKAAKQGD